MNQKAHEPICKRYLTQEPARMEIYGKKEVLYCRMSNLSSSGAFFEIFSSIYMPRPGDIIRVTINLKKMKKSYIVNGEVIWSKTNGVGVSFIKQKELIEKLAG